MLSRIFIIFNEYARSTRTDLGVMLSKTSAERKPNELERMFLFFTENNLDWFALSNIQRVIIFVINANI